VTILWVLLATVVLLAGPFGVEVWRRARHLRRVTRAIAADALAPRRERDILIAAGARHEASVFEYLGSRIALDGYPPFAFGELQITDEDVVLAVEGKDLLRVPLARVIEPTLLPAFGEVRAADVGGILRVDWERGGQRVWTVFAIDGTPKLTEQLRREIHLRAGKARHPALVPPKT